MSQGIERITIKGFAGLDSVCIDLARITALIGPQASGKSVTAKLLYFFRNIWRDLFFSLEIDKDVDSRKDAVKQTFKRYFPAETWGTAMFVLQYEIGGHKISLRRAPSRGKPSDGLILTLPVFSDELFSKLNDYVREVSAKTSPTPFLARYEVWSRIEKDIEVCLGGNYFKSQVFVPAGRAFFSNIENNVFSFISRSEKKLDPFLTEFGEYFSYVKSGGYRRRSAKKEFSTPLAQGLLGGSLMVEDEKEFVKTEDGRLIPLSNLSSGQQEALPLLMMLEMLGDDAGLGRGNDKEKHASYIEEPEAHLFPDFQRRITERIAQYAMDKNGAQSVFITTHSPYVLSTINNLLLAGRLGKAASKNRQKKISELVPIYCWLPPGSVAAYSFSKEGCKSIMDEESGLIDAEYLDSVSTSIGKVFDGLLSIEYPGSEVVSE